MAQVTILAPAEDEPCNVCGDPTCEPGNEIMFCDGCNVAVHQACYGVVDVPEGEWLCFACERNRASGAIMDRQCCLCPVTTGAFKPTNDDRLCHLSCAVWTPETELADHVAMDVVRGVDCVPSWRKKLVCMFCRRKVGACIQCDAPKCTRAFHVSCAMVPTSGCLFDMVEIGAEVEKKIGCPSHNTIESLTPEEQAARQNLSDTKRKRGDKSANHALRKQRRQDGRSGSHCSLTDMLATATRRDLVQLVFDMKSEVSDLEQIVAELLPPPNAHRLLSKLAHKFHMLQDILDSGVTGSAEAEETCASLMFVATSTAASLEGAGKRRQALMFLLGAMELAGDLREGEGKLMGYRMKAASQLQRCLVAKIRSPEWSDALSRIELRSWSESLEEYGELYADAAGALDALVDNL
mmetsp:Transcript_61383/g.133380  ORF Transcript_61383/g.133380 Transcript_61383/m.133380 type:complete len:409 (+) Transcript_61383:1-1227(+)